MAETYVKPTDRRFKDLTGKEFTYIRVLEFRGPTPWRTGFHWWVRCEPELGGCGSEWLVQGGGLTSGQIKSCGCLRAQRAFKHGKHGTRAYQAWLGMIQRCYTPSTKAYKNYGGRGITVCAEWRNDASTFLTWAGDHPLPGETIDRRENDGPYSPDNCRWADRTVQNNNTSRNVRVTFNGKTQTLTEWAHELGIPPTTLFNRVRRGWSTEELLNPKHWSDKRHPNGKSKLLAFNGRVQTQAQWSKELHIPVSTISNRLDRGWSIERTLSQVE
jgi:hypothetical protein